MKRNLILLIAAGAVGVILLFLALNQWGMKDSTPEEKLEVAPSPSPALNQEAMRDYTPEQALAQAQAMVARAVEYMDEHGIASLIEKVNADSSEFHDGEFYVFVMANTGSIVAHPIDPNLVGMPVKQVKDPDGKPFLRRLVKAATRNPDGSWVDYRWVNPVTDEAADKSSWLVMKSGHIIGSGVYSKSE